MAAQHRVCGVRATAHRRLPIVVDRRDLDLLHHAIDDGVEQVVLVGDVAIQRHRLDAEGLAEMAHGEGFDPLGVGRCDGQLDDACAGQRWAGLASQGLCLLVGHLRDPGSCGPLFTA